MHSASVCTHALRNRVAILKVGGSAALGMVGFYMTFVWAPTYLKSSRGMAQARARDLV